MSRHIRKYSSSRDAHSSRNSIAAGPCGSTVMTCDEVSALSGCMVGKVGADGILRPLASDHVTELRDVLAAHKLRQRGFDLLTRSDERRPRRLNTGCTIASGWT